jgi:hypothetical protein
MKHFTLKIYRIFVFILIFSSITCLAAEESSVNKNIYDEIELAMNDLHLHKQCHVNIFNLVEKLKTILTEQDFNKIQVMVMRPSVEQTCLPNTIWLHHVALLFDGHVFDFFNRNQSKKFLGHLYLDYMYENFFDFREMFKIRVSGLTPSFSSRYFRGFNLLDLICRDREISVENRIVSSKDYLSCLDGETILFKHVIDSSSCLTEIESYDKKTFLLWYKHQFNQIIDETDTLLLWDNLNQLHWEGIRDNNWVFDNIANGITDSFQWPELAEMQKRWEKGELTPHKYHAIIQLKN